MRCLSSCMRLNHISGVCTVFVDWRHLTKPNSFYLAYFKQTQSAWHIPATSTSVRLCVKQWQWEMKRIFSLIRGIVQSIATGQNAEWILKHLVLLSCKENKLNLNLVPEALDPFKADRVIDPPQNKSILYLHFSLKLSQSACATTCYNQLL